MRVFSMKNIDRNDIIVIDLDWPIVEFGYGLNLQMVAKAIRLAFSMKVAIKILGNILRKVLSILTLENKNEFK